MNESFLPVEDCRSNSRKLVLLNIFSQRSFFKFLTSKLRCSPRVSRSSLARLCQDGGIQLGISLLPERHPNAVSDFAGEPETSSAGDKTVHDQTTLTYHQPAKEISPGAAQIIDRFLQSRTA